MGRPTSARGYAEHRVPESPVRLSPDGSNPGPVLLRPVDSASPAFVDRPVSWEEERWAAFEVRRADCQATAQVDAFLAAMARSPCTPILSASACSRRRKLKPAAPDFKPRRSVRLALDRRPGSSALQKAQGNLMKKMGVVEEEASISEEELQHYIEVFSRPLTPSELAALAMLFNLSAAEEQPSS